MSYLTMVNEVLQYLREDTVASVGDNDYATLVGKFINLAKEEVEGAAKWDVLRETIQASTVSGTYSYSLTGATYKATILNVFNDTEDSWLCEKDSRYMTANLSTSPTTNDTPMYYSVNGVDSNGYLRVDLWPIPNSVELINFNMVLPEGTLSDDTDTTLLPERVLILKAWALAISERGEDGGVPYSEADQRFRQALGDAIALDASHHSSEFIMEVV